jgi:hypothetical protein
MAPFGVGEARAALAQLMSARGDAHANFRNLDINAAADMLARFSQLGAAAAEHIEAIEINPVAVFTDGRGACALDCLIIPRGRSAGGHR